MVAFVRMLWEPTSVLAKQDGMVSIVKMVKTSKNILRYELNCCRG